jgi:stage II sporulation protein GA (sporulation sigma-E factor processing peptidase)
MYAEWMILMNFLLNLALLRFTQAITNSVIPTWRVFISAFSSAVLTVLFYGDVLITVVSFIVLIGVAFSFKWTSFLHQGKWLIVATLLAGGLLTALQPFLWASSFFVYIFLCFGIVCISLISMKKSWFQKVQQMVQHQYVVSCDVLILEQQFELVAYIDTGNECVEPLSNAPVHFISFQAVQAQLQPDFRASLLAWNETQPYSVAMFSNDMQKIVRIVPLTTVQNRTVLVPAFRATIQLNETTYTNHYVVFTKNDARFPQNAQMIAHVVVLTNS